jgi:hypothetical protein
MYFSDQWPSMSEKLGGSFFRICGIQLHVLCHNSCVLAACEMSSCPISSPDACDMPYKCRRISKKQSKGNNDNALSFLFHGFSQSFLLNLTMKKPEPFF